MLVIKKKLVGYQMKNVFTAIMILCMFFVLNGCSDTDDSAGGSGSDSSSRVNNSNADASVKFDHYNPQAWKGLGIAMVFCVGDARMDSCSINDKAMSLHGAQDHGRDVWTIYHSSGVSGTVTCTRGGETYSYNVSGGHDMTWGKCN